MERPAGLAASRGARLQLFAVRSLLRPAPTVVALPRCSCCAQANWLKAQGVGKGDTVSIYMPMVCQLPIARVSELMHA